MAGISRYDLARKENFVLAACIDQIMTRPLAEVTIKSIGQACGLPDHAAYRAVYRIARDRTHLVQRAALHVSAAIADEIRSGRHVGATIYETIEAGIRHMAGVVESPLFRDFYSLVVRESAFHPWLTKIYDRQVVRVFCAGIEEAVREAGRQAGTAVSFHEGAPRSLLRRLECSLAFAMLLPGAEAGAGHDPQLIRSVAREGIAQTFAWDLGEAA